MNVDWTYMLIEYWRTASQFLCPYLYHHGVACYQGCPQDVKSQDRDETEMINLQDRDLISNSGDPDEMFHFWDRDIVDTSSFQTVENNSQRHAITVRPTQQWMNTYMIAVKVNRRTVGHFPASTCNFRYVWGIFSSMHQKCLTAGHTRSPNSFVYFQTS